MGVPFFCIEGALQGMSHGDCAMQAAQINETLSTCRFAQRMMHVVVDAQKNIGGLASVHGNLMKLDPLMQQYLEARLFL